MDSCRRLWRFPVLGMQGEQLRSSQVDTRGIAGDRQHFASGPEGRLDAHDLPRLALWTRGVSRSIPTARSCPTARRRSRC